MSAHDYDHAPPPPLWLRDTWFRWGQNMRPVYRAEGEPVTDRSESDQRKQAVLEATQCLMVINDDPPISEIVALAEYIRTGNPEKVFALYRDKDEDARED